jgi:hypothetical protein
MKTHKKSITNQQKKRNFLFYQISFNLKSIIIIKQYNKPKNNLQSQQFSNFLKRALFHRRKKIDGIVTQLAHTSFSQR